MIRSTALASLAVLAAFVSPASAQAPGGNGVAGFAISDTGNVMGGGGATMIGGGDNMVILHSPGGAGGGTLRSQVPRLTAVTNGRVGAGSALTPEYMEPERAPPGREAWLMGGGDNAGVVYMPPASR